ncbi:MAG: T9SS type A sorting domain-containing protein [Bacteroidota bacterium]|nr:T9SS type A sorting domain-containing protein [Bacteroidota bacterium]
MKNIYLNKLKKASAKTIFSAIALISANTISAQFTGGNITLLQVGDGTATLANTGNQIILKEFSPLGTPTFSVPVPTTGTNALQNSGTATSEGALSLSSNGQHLIFGGYNTVTTSTTSISGASATLIARGIGMVNAAGVYSLAATSNTYFTGNNIRGAASDGLGNFWGSGNGQGTNYFGNTTVPATIQNTVTNTRSIYHNGTNLLFSTGSGSMGIYSTPTAFTSGGPVTPLILTVGTGTGTPSPYAFYPNPGLTIMYVADDRNSGGGGGVQKWVNVSSVWTLTYTIPTGTVGARGVIANFSGPVPIIYATTAESSANRLVAIADIGAGSTATTIATSATNTIYRGVAFSPTAACTGPSVTVSTSNSTLCSGQSATLTASGATGYSWNTGATTSSIVITPTTSTSYTATGTNTCSSASAIFTQSVVICTGIKSASINGAISIFPNPVKDVLTINIEEQGNYSITIIDAVGKVVYTAETDKNLNVNTSALSQGIYILKVKTPQEQRNYKFIKN